MGGRGERKVRGAAERGIRRAVVRVMVAIGAFAMVGTANGATADTRLIASATHSALSNVEEPRQASGRALANRFVQGKAGLDRDNVLDWQLRNLPPNSEGTVRIHVGRLCEEEKESLWDNTKVNQDPWLSVHWKSNLKGKSAGSVDVDKIKGAYSFLANIGHTVGFYNFNGGLLACKKLQPEGFRNYGAGSEITSGSTKKKVTGKIILSKSNELTWGLYGLPLQGEGTLTIQASPNCKSSLDAVHISSWYSNIWGASRGRVVLSDYSFEQAVGNAVVIRNAFGKMLACTKLDLFVEKVPHAKRAVMQQFQEIVQGYKAEALKGSVIAEVGAFQDIPMQCIARVVEAQSAASQIQTLAGFLEGKKKVYATALEAVESGSFKKGQLTLVKKYEASQKRNSDALAVLSDFSQFYKSTCELTKKCRKTVATLEQNENKLLDLTQGLAKREEEFSTSLSAVEERKATKEQKHATEEYRKMMAEKANLEKSMKSLVKKAKARCPENYSCGHAALELGRCTHHERYDKTRLEVAKSYEGLLSISLQLAEMEVEHQPALTAQSEGTATKKQRNVIKNYARVSAELSDLLSEMQEEYYRVNVIHDPSPSGSFTLSKENELSWTLDDVPFGAAGQIMIHEGTSCDLSEIGSPAAKPGTSPYSHVFWDTTHRRKRDYNYGRTKGSVYLPELDGTLPYKENLRKPVVVYDADMKQVACGMLTPH